MVQWGYDTALDYLTTVGGAAPLTDPNARNDDDDDAPDAWRLREPQPWDCIQHSLHQRFELAYQDTCAPPLKQFNYYFADELSMPPPPAPAASAPAASAPSSKEHSFTAGKTRPISLDQNPVASAAPDADEEETGAKWGLGFFVGLLVGSAALVIGHRLRRARGSMDLGKVRRHADGISLSEPAL